LENDLRPTEYEAVNEGHCGAEKAIEPRIGDEYVAQAGDRTDNGPRAGKSSSNAAVQNAFDREVVREARPFQTIELDQAP